MNEVKLPILYIYIYIYVYNIQRYLYLKEVAIFNGQVNTFTF